MWIFTNLFKTFYLNFFLMYKDLVGVLSQKHLSPKMYCKDKTAAYFWYAHRTQMPHFSTCFTIKYFWMDKGKFCAAKVTTPIICTTWIGTDHSCEVWSKSCQQKPGKVFLFLALMPFCIV